MPQVRILLARVMLACVALDTAGYSKKVRIHMSFTYMVGKSRNMSADIIIMLSSCQGCAGLD